MDLDLADAASHKTNHIIQPHRQQGEQVADIDSTKVTLKKRSGILSFVRVFPLFVDRMEALTCATTAAPTSRAAVTKGYTQVVRSIFETLAEVAQLVQNDSKTAADDKDQLNIHILMVGRWRLLVCWVTFCVSVASPHPHTRTLAHTYAYTYT